MASESVARSEETGSKAAPSKKSEKASANPSTKQPPKFDGRTSDQRKLPHSRGFVRQRWKPVDVNKPLPIDSSGRVRLNWDVLARTTFDAEFRPKFPPNVVKIDGQQVTVQGLMNPLDQVQIVQTFLLVEYRADCLECQTADPSSLVLVELAGARRVPVHYGPVTIRGKLKLNADDPDDFLFLLTEAQILARE